MNGRPLDRVRSVADRARLRVIRSVLAGSVVVCVASGAVLADRVAHPVRRATFNCWIESDPRHPSDSATMCAWFEFRAEPSNARSIVARVQENR